MNLLPLVVAYVRMPASAGSTSLVSQSARAWLFSCEASTATVDNNRKNINVKADLKT
jgi:hypothetical protein